MPDIAVQLLIVAALAVVVVLVARGTRRWQRPTHEPVDISGAGLPTGLVIFTSTECEKCRAARNLVKTMDAPLREVTWELEPGLLEEVGVTAVPLTIVVGPDGAVVHQVVGIPSKRKLERALVVRG